MKRRLMVLLIIVFLIAGCDGQKDQHTIKVGTIAGPETEVMEVAKQVAKDRYGLDVKIIRFSDYATPNVALNSGDIDANVFQHRAFLQAQIQSRGFRLVSIGKTFIYPMGFYSKKIKSLSELKSGDKVAIANDPSNEARALNLLQTVGLIELKPGHKTSASTLDIIKNPKQLQFVELDAAQLPRSLDDVAMAAINVTFAIPAGLTPADAILIENKHSPYANIIVVRQQDANSAKLNQLVKAYQSEPVMQAAQRIFGNSALPAW